MASGGLAFDQAPPISVPLRFFLTAPAFGVAAAAVLAWAGPSAFGSRWTPGLLAATHLVVLGVLAMCMIGALLQMLPVVAGAVLRAPLRLAALIHPALTVGAALLAAGLFSGVPALLLSALPLLLGGLFAFGVVALRALLRAPARNATVTAMKAAISALLVTASIGLMLAWGLAGRISVPLPQLTDLHLAWGLLGWVGVLIVGVAYQVVPMFQLTAPYPLWLSRMLLPVLLVGLCMLTVAQWADSIPWRFFGAAVLAVGFTAFLSTTLLLQQRRRRKAPDVTLRFWRVAMASGLTGVGLWLAATLNPAIGAAPETAILLGLSWVFGFALSAVNGMLYKIVPFLVWLHAQNLALPRGGVPNMKQIITDESARRQAMLHEAALVALALAVFWPAVSFYPALALAALSFLLLAWNLARAFTLYRRLAQAGRGGLQPVSR